MKKIRLLTFSLGLFSAFFAADGVGAASRAGASDGLTLMDLGSARGLALAGAYSAGVDDITALGFNPASLRSLSSGNASLYFQRGIENQSRGHVHVGRPSAKRSLGLSIGYFDGGTFEAVDGATTHTVSLQKDLTASLGSAWRLRRTDVGVAVKYLSSELGGLARASTVAIDLGLQMPVTARLRVAGAVQNLGRGLKYADERGRLPRLLRAGARYQLPLSRTNSLLYADLPYLLNEKDLQPALGLEVGFGVLAMRGGVARKFDDLNFTVGLGLGMGSMSLDYGAALISNLDVQHQMNVGVRFSGARANAAIVRAPEPETKPARHTLGSLAGDAPRPTASVQRRLYIVVKGDTLATIALRHYGRRDLWKQIYNANALTMKNPNDVAVGQKIILPAAAR